MGRHIVCLTFDFDATSGWTSRGMTTPTPISRGEFGAVGAERLLGLLEKQGIRSTWFIPGLTIETYPAACASVVDHSHEIAHHGWTHLSPPHLTREQEELELTRANETIRTLSGRSARGYRSPAWDLSPHTVDLLLANDFVYDSSLMGHDYQPYLARQGDTISLEGPVTFGEQTPLIEMPVSWSLDDGPHFEFVRTGNVVRPGQMSAGAVLRNWVDDFLYLRRSLEWGIITYTCHPYVSGRGHRMLMLERLIETLKEHDAEFMTMEMAAGAYSQRARTTVD